MSENRINMAHELHKTVAVIRSEFYGISKIASALNVLGMTEAAHILYGITDSITEHLENLVELDFQRLNVESYEIGKAFNDTINTAVAISKKDT